MLKSLPRDVMHMCPKVPNIRTLHHSCKFLILYVEVGTGINF